MAKIVLHSVREVIEALGGNPEAAALIGVGRSAPSNWLSANKFPASTYIAIRDELARAGLGADIELWNWRRGHDKDRAQ